MATRLFTSTRIVHFRYPSHKATAYQILEHSQKTTATLVLGHATIKFRKPLHIRGIGVRALSNDGFIGINGKFQKCKPNRISPSELEYDCEDEILKFLKPDHPDKNLPKLAENLSKLLEHIGTHPEKEAGLVHLYRKNVLRPVHIQSMWMIAGYNHTNKAVDMLPRDKQSPVKWGWMTGNIHEILDRKRPRGDEDLQKPRKQFPLEGEWKMEIHRGDNGGSYSAVLEAKLGFISRCKRLGSPQKLKLVLVEKNGSVIPTTTTTTERFGLAFEFGGSLWPSSDHFVMYVRAAGPNVLIGQAWAGGENSKRLWAEVVIVKRE